LQKVNEDIRSQGIDPQEASRMMSGDEAQEDEDGSEQKEEK
jgi:hypothetical protein